MLHLGRSNVEQFDWEKLGRVLEAVQGELGLRPDDLEAISRVEFNFLFVWRAGHVLADENGLFKKRVEIGKPVAYDGRIQLLKNQKGVRGRDGMLIEGFVDGGRPLFELSWGCGGPVSIEDAAGERDRIFEVMRPLIA